MKDANGNTIRKGDAVFYPCRESSSCFLRLGTVVELEKARYGKGSAKYGQVTIKGHMTNGINTRFNLNVVKAENTGI